MAPSCSLRDTGDGRAPQVTGSEAATRGPCGDVPELPSPRPVRSVRPAGGAGALALAGRNSRAPGPSAVAAGECQRGPGRPWARAMGVAVGSLPPIPRDRTHRVVMGGSARASPAGARDPGRRPPTRAFPLKLSSQPGGDAGGARLWTTGVSVPASPYSWLLVARKICSVAGGLARDLGDLLRVTKGHAHGDHHPAGAVRKPGPSPG